MTREIDWRWLLAEQRDRYPAMEAIDLYKVIHQTATGPGHAIDVPLAAKERLFDEARELDLGNVGEWESGVEILDAERELARVHLRPFLRAGGELDRLAAAMVESAELCSEYPRSAVAEGLAEVITALASEAETGAIDLDELKRLSAESLKEGFPAHHHSEAYREAYRPSYRVILLTTLR